MKRQMTPDDVCRNNFGMRAAARPISVTSEDELEFLIAMEQYKRRSGRQFPTWSEILEVLRSIGYEKRIWRPVDTWSSVLPDPSGEHDAADLIGWCASVETAACS